MLTMWRTLRWVNTKSRLLLAAFAGSRQPQAGERGNQTGPSRVPFEPLEIAGLPLYNQDDDANQAAPSSK